jgi:hypothetical protein
LQNKDKRHLKAVGTAKAKTVKNEQEKICYFKLGLYWNATSTQVKVYNEKIIAILAIACFKAWFYFETKNKDLSCCSATIHY